MIRLTANHSIRRNEEVPKNGHIFITIHSLKTKNDMTMTLPIEDPTVARSLLILTEVRAEIGAGFSCTRGRIDPELPTR